MVRMGWTRTIAIGTSLWIGASAAAEDCQRLREYDEITASVSEKFYDKSFHGIDWSARLRHYRARVNCHEDEDGLARTLNGLLSELNASHTAVYTRNDLEYWALQSIFSRDLAAYEIAFSGIWPEQRDGRWHAKYVLPTSPAAQAGILNGDALIGIDGDTFRPLAMNESSVATLTVSSDGLTSRDVRIRPAKKSISRFLLDASRQSVRIIPIDGRSVGYFHLWSGTHALFLQALNEALITFEKQTVDALVLDLRGGFGGASLDYVAKLKHSEYLRSIPRFALIDDGVRSGKELLAGTLKHEKLAMLVGSRTAGAFLGGSPVRFQDDRYLLYVAVGNFVPPGIGPIEGVGIEPDVAVPACRAYCAGRDPQLEAALELVEDRLRQSG